MNNHLSAFPGDDPENLARQQVKLKLPTYLKQRPNGRKKPSGVKWRGSRESGKLGKWENGKLGNEESREHQRDRETRPFINRASPPLVWGWALNSSNRLFTQYFPTFFRGLCSVFPAVVGDFPCQLPFACCLLPSAIHFF